MKTILSAPGFAMSRLVMYLQYIPSRKLNNRNHFLSPFSFCKTYGLIYPMKTPIYFSIHETS